MSKKKPAAATQTALPILNPAREPGRCIYFGDLQLGACAAGIEYATVRVQHEEITDYSIANPYPRVNSLPCQRELNPARATCAHRQLPTNEEVRAWREAGAVLVAHTIQVRREIMHSGKAEGTVRCPKCGGHITFTQRADKGVSARCDTLGCFRLDER